MVKGGARQHFTSYLTPSPFSKSRRGLIQLSTIQDSFFHNYYNWGNQDPAFAILWLEKTHYKTQCWCGEKNQCWRRLNLARSPGGKTENYFWASSSHLFNSTYTNNNSFDIKMKKKKSGWHTDVLEDSTVVRAPSFRPGLLLRCDAVHWIPDTTKKQRIPFDVIHSFALPTIMKYNVFGGRGPKG